APAPPVLVGPPFRGGLGGAGTPARPVPGGPVPPSRAGLGGARAPARPVGSVAPALPGPGRPAFPFRAGLAAVRARPRAEAGGRGAVRAGTVQALGGLLLQGRRVRPGRGGSAVTFRLVGRGVGWRVVGLAGGHVDVLLDLPRLEVAAPSYGGCAKTAVSRSSTTRKPVRPFRSTHHLARSFLRCRWF